MRYSPPNCISVVMRCCVLLPGSRGLLVDEAESLAIVARRNRCFGIPQSVGHRCGVTVGYLLRRQGASGFVPGRNPIDCAGDGERGEFYIARGDGSVIDALLDERSEAAVDFSFVAADFDARLAAQFSIVEPHDRSAEVICNHGSVRADERRYLFDSRSTLRRDLVEAFADEE